MLSTAEQSMWHLGWKTPQTNFVRVAEFPISATLLSFLIRLQFILTHGETWKCRLPHGVMWQNACRDSWLGIVRWTKSKKIGPLFLFLSIPELWNEKTKSCETTPRRQHVQDAAAILLTNCWYYLKKRCITAANVCLLSNLWNV